jgi:hypothetical protein
LDRRYATGLDAGTGGAHQESGTLGTGGTEGCERRCWNTRKANKEMHRASITGLLMPLARRFRERSLEMPSYSAFSPRMSICRTDPKRQYHDGDCDDRGVFPHWRISTFQIAAKLCHSASPTSQATAMIQMSGVPQQPRCPVSFHIMFIARNNRSARSFAVEGMTDNALP